MPLSVGEIKGSIPCGVRVKGLGKAIMTKTIIRTSTVSATGYELVYDGNVVSIDKTYPGEPTTLVLPVNPSNRKYFSSKKVDAAGGELELEYKESKHTGPRSESTPRKGLEEWLDDEDRAAYLALVEKAKSNREAAQKAAKTPKKSKAELEAELEAALAELEALKKVEA